MDFIWQLLVLIGMAFMANVKVLVQGKFGRSVVKTTADVTCYNGLLFLFAALSFFVIFFELRLPSLLTWLMAAGFGLGSVVFQLAYLSAMKCGPVSLTVLLNNFSVIITSLFGVVAYGEDFTPFKAAGLVLVLCSFVFTVKTEQTDSTFNWKWLALTLTAAVSGAAGSVLLKIHQNTPYHSERTLFVPHAYLVAAVLSAVLVLVFRQRGQPVTFRLKPSLLLPTAGAGVVLGLYQFLSLWLARRMDSMVMYPINSCTCILVSFLFGVVFFKDRLTPRQWFGSVLGIVGVVLISL